MDEKIDPGGLVENGRITPRHLLKAATHDRRRITLANALAVLAALCSVPVPLLLPLMVDEVLLQQPGAITAAIDSVFTGPHGAVFYIGLVLAATVLLRVLSWGFGVGQLLLFLRVSKHVTYSLRAALLHRLSRVSLSAYDSVGSGKIASHLVTDMNTIDDFVGVTVSGFLVSVMSIIATAIVVILLHWQLALFLLLLNPLVIYFTMLIGRKVKTLKKEENKAIEVFQQAMTETLDAIHQIRASNRSRHYFERTRGLAREVKTRSVRFRWRSDSSSRLSFLLFLIGFDVFRVVGMLMVLLSDLSIGEMIAVFGYLWFMLGPIQEVLNMQYAWYGAKAAMERVNAMLDMPEEPRYRARIDPFIDRLGVSLETRDLCLSYDGEHDVLDRVNLKIEPGRKVALVGASGGGKTTLVYALLGLHELRSGEVLYGGVSIKDIGLETVRQNVSCVLQRPALLDGTIRDNLLLGGRASEDDVWRVLEVAQIDDFVRECPEGLDTSVGVRGVKLSGGQTQRLAIARMLLTEARVVILDEASSAIDSETEARLHQALFRELSSKTVLIVAHRLSAVRQADCIYVFDGGRIAEHGEHHDLVLRNGLYRQLFDTQLEA